MYPKALPHTFGGNVSATIAPLLACMKAPPSAWITREAMSHVIVGDKPQNSEPRVNMTKPVLNIRLRPYMSSILPS